MTERERELVSAVVRVVERQFEQRLRALEAKFGGKLDAIRDAVDSVLMETDDDDELLLGDPDFDGDEFDDDGDEEPEDGDDELDEDEDLDGDEGLDETAFEDQQPRAEGG